MLDISSYLEKIHDENDKPMFEEAVKCAKEDAHRAAYVMIWISCAESLKRRFKEASKRDCDARKVSGKVDKTEEEHKSVDKYLLNEAKKYGMISDTSYTILLNIYELRCVYGHPYEESPSDEQVTHAASVVVEELLKHPVRLRHGFCQTLLNSLLKEKSYLDDQQKAVELFATEIIPRIDESVFGWMLDNYLIALEKMADDSSMKIYFWRGVWFCRMILSKVGIAIFSKEEWHDRVRLYPLTLLRVCTKKTIFKEIGSKAKMTLVSKTLEMASKRPTILQALEKLNNKDAFSGRLKQMFNEYLLDKSDSSNGIKCLRASKLSTKTCFTAIVESLKSHDWYIQKYAVDIVVANGIIGVSELGEDQQLELGRNILQTAEGKERKARLFLNSDDLFEWPQQFLRGLLLECFVNEMSVLRFKTDRLKAVMQAIEKCDKDDKEKHSETVVEAIRKSKPRHEWFDADNFNGVEKIVRKFEWANEITTELSTKRKSMPVDDSEDF